MPAEEGFMARVARLPHLLRRLAARARRQWVPFVFSGGYVMEVPGAPLDPRRGENILTFLAMEGLLHRGGLRWPRPISWPALARVHREPYLDSLLAPGGLERVVGVRLPDAAEQRFLGVQRAMTGGTLLAARLAIEERGPAVNLGGGLHHAHAGRGGGFCALNDVAVAVAALRAEGFDKPVLVIDLDLHDGDGTRTIFAADRTVYTYSIHNQSWDDLPAYASTSIALGAGIGDAAYLATLSATLPEVIASHRPGMVFYLAGSDPAADDGMGNWKITPAGMLERDLRVMDALRTGARGVPMVILLAGGYGSEAWRYSARFFAWLLSGGQEIEPPSTDEVTLERLRYLAGLVDDGSLTTEPTDGDDFGLTAEDILPGTAGSARPTRFLGFYSSHGLERALERYGYLAHLRSLGYSHPRIELELDHPAGHTLRIWGSEDRSELLVELRARVDRQSAPGRALLFVEWLLLQNPRRSFPASRPPLPGQQHPGLGLLRETTALLMVVCQRLGLDGIAFVPSHFHLAAQSERYLRFLRPEDEGLFRALRRDLAGLALDEATRAVAEGRVVDLANGETYRWQAAPMVLAVSDALKAEVEGPAYEERSRQAGAGYGFAVAAGTTVAAEEAGGLQ